MDKFLATIRTIKELHAENEKTRQELFMAKLDTEKQRQHKRDITQRIDQIFDLLKEWRLEANVIDEIEGNIRYQIQWFDEMSKNFSMS